MTQLEACAYERIQELERKMDILRDGLEELNIKLRIITDNIKDEQTRRKWGVSDEATKLLTAEEWEKELNPRAWIPSLNRYATGFDKLYYHRQMNGVGEWWCCQAGEDEQLDVEIESSTGLKDKNGKEIYMCDIVSERHGDIIGKIVREPSGEYRIAWLGIYGSDSSLYYHRSLCEVIGNIHENPELLEINDVD